MQKRTTQLTGDTKKMWIFLNVWMDGMMRYDTEKDQQIGKKKQTVWYSHRTPLRLLNSSCEWVQMRQFCIVYYRILDVCCFNQAPCSNGNERGLLTHWHLINCQFSKYTHSEMKYNNNLTTQLNCLYCVWLCVINYLSLLITAKRDGRQ